MRYYWSGKMVLITLVLAGIVLGAKMMTTARAAVDDVVPTDSVIAIDEANRNYYVDYGESMTVPVTITADRDEYVVVVPGSRDITSSASIVRLDPRDGRTGEVELTLNSDGNLDAGTHHLQVAFQPQDGGTGRLLDVTLHVSKVTLTVTSVDPVTKEFGEAVNPDEVNVETTEGPKTLGELGLTAPSFAEETRAGTYHDRLNPSRSPNYEIEGGPKVEVTVEAVEPKLIGVTGSGLASGAMVLESQLSGIALNPSTDELVYGTLTWDEPGAKVSADDADAGVKTATYRFTPFDTTDYHETSGTVEIPVLR